ncbi:MAG: hypothetical protein WB502_01620, partial [Thermoactinomyces sp.]
MKGRANRIRQRVASEVVGLIKRSIHPGNLTVEGRMIHEFFHRMDDSPFALDRLFIAHQLRAQVERIGVGLHRIARRFSFAGPVRLG